MTNSRNSSAKMIISSSPDGSPLNSPPNNNSSIICSLLTNNNNFRGRTTFVLFMIGCTLHIFGILLGFMLGSLNEQSNYIVKMEKDIATLVGGGSNNEDNNDKTTTTTNTAMIMDDPMDGGNIRGSNTVLEASTSELTSTTTSTTTTTTTSNTIKTFGLSYLRCKEDVDYWIQDIPPHWNITIWEKCLDESSPDITAHSVQLPPNQRDYEAIGAHLKYIMENYYTLPDVVVFSRDSQLVRQRKSQGDDEDEDSICPPTPYYSLHELQNDLDQYLHGGFLHLSTMYPMQEKLFGEPYHGNFSLPSLSYMLPNVNVTMFQELPYIPAIHFIPGGTYATTRERIHHLALEQYKKLSNYMTTPPEYELPRFIKKKSAAMDRLVQVLFGEPFLLPPESYARTFRNKQDKHGCPGQKQLGDRYRLEDEYVGGPTLVKETLEEQQQRRCTSKPQLAQTIEAISLKQPLENGTTPPYYGMSIVRCSERSSEWIKSIKRDWGLVVWEKCNEMFDERYSSRARHGVGGEDLSAHMKYILRHYHNLPNISIFMQADGLMGYEQIGRKCPHTPYCTLQDLEHDLEQHLDGFFQLGAMEPSVEDLFNASYHGIHSMEVLQIIAKDDDDDDIAKAALQQQQQEQEQNQEQQQQQEDGQTIKFVLGSHFAVTRERILSHSMGTYQNLYDFIFKEEPIDANARRRACALERFIHVLFGEPILMPQTKCAHSIHGNTIGCEGKKTKK